MSVTPYYPPAYTDTYIKASDSYGGYGLVPYNAADPGLSLTGGMASASWQSTSAARNNLKFSIDLGQAQSVNRLLLHNLHDSGGLTARGINNFSLYGTDSATAFASTDYSDLTDLTLLGSYSAIAHVASDISDPQFFTFAGASFRYFVLRIADNHGDTGGTGIRHLELQLDTGLQVLAELTLPTPTISGEASSGRVVTGALEISTPVISGTATTERVVTAALVVPTPTISGYTVLEVDGDMSAPQPTISGTATSILAQGQMQAPSPVIAGTATSILAQGSMQVPTPVIDGEAEWYLGSFGECVFPKFSCESESTFEDTAAGECVFPKFTCEGHAGATGECVFPNFLCESEVVVWTISQGVAVFPRFSCDAEAVVVHLATGVTSFPRFFCESEAVVGEVAFGECVFPKFSCESEATDLFYRGECVFPKFLCAGFADAGWTELGHLRHERGRER